MEVQLCSSFTPDPNGNITRYTVLEQEQMSPYRMVRAIITLLKNIDAKEGDLVIIKYVINGETTEQAYTYTKNFILDFDKSSHNLISKNVLCTLKCVLHKKQIDCVPPPYTC